MSSISSVGSSASALSSAITGTSGGSTGSTSSSGSEVANISGTGILSTLGLGSGLDVSSIITALVNAAEAAPQAEITNTTNADDNQIAGLTALSTALTGLQSALSELTASSTYQTFTAAFSANSTSASGVGTATTLPDATPGSYSVDVTQLATAETSVSSPFSSGATVGAGTMDITVGKTTMDLSVSASDSLETIATNINNASNNPGVTANVIAGANGDQLVLTSQQTGTANAFTVSASSDSSSGLTALASQLNSPGSGAATDAELTVDGIPVTSSTNNVSGALTGVTMNLTSTGSSTLTVSQSTAPISTAVNDFVTAYNNYNTDVGELASFNASTGQAGVLLGDPTLDAIQTQLSHVMSSTVQGNSIGSLASLGITRNSDGSLTLNSETLDNDLSSDPSAVQNLFASTNGIGTQLNSLVTNYSSSSGILQTRINDLNTDVSNLSTQQTALNTRMATYQEQLVKQYSNLDTLMTSLDNTSSYLTDLEKQSTSSSNG
ncbi:flagellar filament capping protein FliD [Dyella sp.]|jgi:flagellar hook-associated protein 2|uniref:flagellar filament capping protein FliD n=1 Tax=Dyella sp. TaxID=1869338 RepID=UPI002D1D0FA9|nr:flagellar filament capping protein FliD [Dyella sp.]HTC26478.1 flagellar filament capping protein FliD [Dyella sp.]